MRKVLMSAVATLAFAGSALADDLIGDWRTAADDNGNSGLIRVEACGDMLCGTLVEAYDANGATMSTPNIGRQIIWDTTAEGDGEYRGMLYSPDRDRNYRSRLQLSGSGLSVSGCVLGGAICREGGVWQRAN